MLSIMGGRKNGNGREETGQMKESQEEAAKEQVA